ncbi:ligand-binding sensor domain-containing protein [Lysobacter arvi]
MGWLRGLWLLACAMPAFAGTPEVPRPRQVGVEAGLPSNQIQAITEDRDGYLWIGTADGLARYDGKEFRVWRVEDGLHDNDIWSLHVDARNRLWIGTREAGLAMLDRTRQRLTFYDRAHTPGMGSDQVWSIASTPDDAIWFGTSPGGLHRLAPDGTLTRFMPIAGDAHSLPGDEVGHLVVTPSGDLWVGTLNGAARWTGSGFERVPDEHLASLQINGITADADGTLWFGTANGVTRRHPDGRFERAPWPDGNGADVLQVLLRDRHGRYWLDILKGLGYAKDGGVDVVPLYSQATQGLVRPSWTTAYEDRQGGVWFASYTHGLWYLPPAWRQFAVLTRRIGDPASLGNGMITGIAPASPGGVWLVGSSGVLDRLDPDTGAVVHVIDDKHPYSHLQSQQVLEDARGFVWCTDADGIVRIDPRTRGFRRWTRKSTHDPTPDSVPQIAEVGGKLWVLGERGDAQIRDHDGRVTASIPAGSGTGLPSDFLVEQIGAGPDGALWVAGALGLWRWDASAQRFVAVIDAEGRHVYGFAMQGGRVWLARFGAIEPYRWTGQGLEPLPGGLDARDGMPLTALNGLVVDAQGIAWVTAVRGLIRADPATRTVRVYGTSDGLPGQRFDAAPVSWAGHGRILVGSPEGLVMFDPASVRPDPQMPVTIEGIEVARGDKRVALDPARPFELTSDDRDLRVSARLLSFNDGRNHAYRFRLSGYDTDWVDVGNSGERVLPRLEPGRYRMEVIARGADNVWSSPRSIAFTVVPPWWRTWWALAAQAVLAMLLCGWAVVLYRRRLKRRHAWELTRHQREMAEQASLAKTHFLATLGHEVRTPMTGVLGMSELLLDTPLDRDQRGYVESIRRAGRHLLRLVNDALDLARIESGRLELADAPFDLHAVVAEAAALMAPLARQRGLAFRVDIDDEAPRGLRGDVNRVGQVLLNLLSNAIKFTDRGSVWLHVAPLHPQGVRVEVGDTGPGLSPEQRARLFRRFEQGDGARTAARYGGSGLGLAICQELTAEMGGTITVSSTPGEGARFIVALPLPVASPPTPVEEPSLRLDGEVDPLSLLLVEDDPTVAQVIVAMLRVQGHRVAHASNGLQALSEAATSRFDAALLDLDLPGMDGLALASLLRSQGFDRPLLAITARADADAESQTIKAGFQGFVRKPVTMAMLGGLLACVPAREVPD